MHRILLQPPPPTPYLQYIFELMCLTTVADESNPPLNAVQLMVSNVFMFHENIVLLPYGDFYDLSQGRNDPNNHITLVLVGLPVSNQLVWVEVANFTENEAPMPYPFFV